MTNSYGTKREERERGDLLVRGDYRLPEILERGNPFDTLAFRRCPGTGPVMSCRLCHVLHGAISLTASVLT